MIDMCKRTSPQQMPGLAEDLPEHHQEIGGANRD